MSDDIKMTWTGSSTDAEKAIATLERKYDSLEARLKRTGRTSKMAHNESARGATEHAAAIDKLTTALTRMTTQYAPALIGLGAIQKGLMKIGDINLRVSKELGSFGKGWVQEQVKVAIQGGVDEKQVQKQMDNVSARLRETPVMTLPQAQELQKGIAGAGFQPKDVESGEAAASVFRLHAATGSFGKDLGDPISALKPVTQLIKAYGNAQPSAADIENVAGSITELYAESDIQLPDISQLAPKGAALKNFGVDLRTGLAAFSTLTDVMGPEKGATGLGAFVTRTATAGASKEKTEALAMMGIIPDQVAMSEGGVTFQQASERLRAGMKRLSPEQRGIVATKLWGEEGQGAASLLLSDQGFSTTQRRRAELEAPDKYGAAVKTFQESRHAAGERAGVDVDNAKRQMVARSQTWDEMSGQLDAAIFKGRAKIDAEETGMRRFAFNVGASVLQAGAEIATWTGGVTGISPAAAGLPQPQFIQNGNGAPPKDVNVKAPDLAAKLDKIIEVLENGNQRPAPAPIRQVNPEGGP